MTHNLRCESRFFEDLPSRMLVFASQSGRPGDHFGLPNRPKTLLGRSPQRFLFLRIWFLCDVKASIFHFLSCATVLGLILYRCWLIFGPFFGPKIVPTLMPERLRKRSRLRPYFSALFNMLPSGLPPQKQLKTSGFCF